MKKYLSYILILIAFVGFFGLVQTKRAQAEQCGTTNGSKQLGYCAITDKSGKAISAKQTTEDGCTYNSSTQNCSWVANGSQPSSTGSTPASQTQTPTEPLGYCLDVTNPQKPISTGQTTSKNCPPPKVWQQNGSQLPTSNSTPDQQEAFKECRAGVAGTDAEKNAACASYLTASNTYAPKQASDSSLLNAINEDSCTSWTGVSPGGCVKQLFYYVIYLPSAFILMIAAIFMNALLSIALSSTLFSSSTFIPTAWAVVRDLSNIFFIIALLYIAIKLILGLTGHGVQQALRNIIIIALLVNFSMFFTKVIIDSSNVLALIFYNKLNVNITANGQPRPYDQATSTDKDISGAMYNTFDPTTALNGDFWEKTKKTINPIDGSVAHEEDRVPVGIMVGVILIASAVMLVAAYAFFLSGFAFLGRMIELWILIIVSPFAFVSYAVPFLNNVEYASWGAWFKRLTSVAFMAPIFMFFMYLIFLLIQGNLFGNLITNKGNIVFTLLNVLIPALVIIILLLKATSFAKKGSGVFGEAIMKGAKLAGGLAVGAATGGASMALSNTVGRAARNTANDEDLKAKAAAGDKGAQRKLALANSLAKSSFDVRQTGLGKFAAKKTGMDFDKGLGIAGLDTKSLKGGRKERDKEAAKKFDEIVKTYAMSKADAEQQDVRAKQYKADEKTIKANFVAENKISTEAADWEKQYAKDKAIAESAPRGKNQAAFDEKKFRADYEAGKYVSVGGRTIKAKQKPFTEKEFREAYEKGGDMTRYGLNKTVTAGVIEKAEDVDKRRRNEYADHLANRSLWRGGPVHREIVANVRKGVKSSLEESAEHMQHALHDAGIIKHEEHGEHKEGEHEHKEHKEEGGGDHGKPDAGHAPAAHP